MFEIAGEALVALLDPARFAWLALGTALGLIVGVLPGMGGIAGLSVLIPFIFGMDPYNGIALLLGMTAVTSTSDTYPSVLLGVPGSSSSQATIMDGYPLARQGMAGRAFGAAFTSSMLGGLIGAVIIFALLPFARPIVLAIGAPQLLMLALFGVSMVGVMSRGKPVPGLLAGVMGLMLSAVGTAPAGGQRYVVFDWLYLWSGVSLILVALGLFAIPEFMDLFAEDEKIAAEGQRRGSMAGLLRGTREAIRHKWIIVTASVGSAVLAMIPGLGGSAIQWIVYGTASQTLKDNENFGKGDIRGVIAPEASNNAVDGGALIPTIMFGIPGNGSTALLLGAFVLLGIQPGPSMVSDENLPLVLTIIWSLALANVLATAVCYLASNAMIRLTNIPSRRLVPFLSVLILVVAFQNSQRWGDIIVVMVLGVTGWIMKTLDWPRAPVIIGFVLGPAIERYLRISLDRYGTTWMVDPFVLAIAALTLLTVAYGVRSQWKESNLAKRLAAVSSAPTSLDSGDSATPPPQPEDQPQEENR